MNLTKFPLEATAVRDALDHAHAYWRSASAVATELAELTPATLDDATFRLLADNVPTLCWVANGDGYIVWYNRRWHDYAGTTPAAMEGWGWTSVHDPELLPAVMERWREAIATGEPFEMTFPLRGADGVFRPFLTRIVPVRDATGRIARWCGVNTEISDQLAAEEALRAERDRYTEVLNGMTEGFALLAPDFRILAVNAEGLRLETRAAEEIVGHSHWDAYPGTEDSEIGRLYKRAMAERVPVSLEHRYEWDDGRETWLDMRAYPVAEGLAVFYRDVTDRKQAQQRALDGERRYRTLFDTMDEGFCVIEFLDGPHGPLSDYVHVEANPAYAVHTGIPDVVGQRLRNMVGDEADAWLARYRPVLVTGEPVRFRQVLETTGRCLEVSAFRVEPAERRQVAVLFQDVTGGMQAEAALRESEERLRAVFDTVPVGIVMAEAPSGRITGGNAQAERIFRHAILPSAEAEQYGEWVGRHPDGRRVEAAEYPLFRAIRGLEERPELEVLYQRGDGSEAWVRLIAAPIRNGGDAITGGVVASLDIDREKRAEAELRELAETLEGRVAAAIAEREQVEDALRQSQKMEAVGQLTGGVAHDFNNLLTIVIGNIDMAARALEQAGGDPRTRRALDSAQKGAERAAALTQRLLAFSRRQPLAPKPIDVDKLVAGMSDLLNRALGEIVKLEIVTSPGLWRIEADPNQLESAILNLAVNARDAMPRGGELTVETANARLDEEYSANHAEVAPGNYVVISVSDTGAGMPKTVLDRVFDPFFTTKEVGKGTGLGLSQVYGFVKQSGGHVKLYSEEGKGTTVKLYLPRLMSEVSEDEATLTLGVEASQRQETVLVVEDDDDVRAYTVECLRELGYRVLEAHDGPSALRLLQRQDEPVELLFTDVVMPGMSGNELADAARKLQGDLKVLYTSGYTRNAIVHGGRLNPGVEMIAKPFTFQALAQKIRDVLDQGRTKRVLVVEDEPTVRALAVEALGQAGYAADEAANAAEALSRLRAAQGRYDVVVLDSGLPDRPGEALVAELRALYADLPVLVASGERADELSERFAKDRCTAVIAKPYTGGKLAEAMRSLGVQCSRSG